MQDTNDFCAKDEESEVIKVCTQKYAVHSNTSVMFSCLLFAANPQAIVTQMQLSFQFYEKYLDLHEREM